MDRDPQTAAELHAIVSQWPEEARPSDLDAAYGEWYRASAVTNIYSNAHAIDLHIASGLLWLLERGPSLRITQPCEGAPFRVLLKYGFVEHEGDGPTLFLALHAAILAAKENA